MESFQVKVNNVPIVIEDEKETITKLRKDDKLLQLYIQNCVENNSLVGYGTQDVITIERIDEKTTNENPVWTDDLEELLIGAVCKRPPLFNFKLNLALRSKSITGDLWDEIKNEINSPFAVEEIIKKWKNIRDSYIRAKDNITQKLKSGSSNSELLQAEKIKENHKHYNLLHFIDDTIKKRKTACNATPISTPNLTPPPEETSTLSSRETSKTKQRSDISASDKEFLKILSSTSTGEAKSLTSTEHFCLRLAAGLHKLPKRKKNELEILFLQKLAEAENDIESD